MRARVCVWREIFGQSKRVASLCLNGRPTHTSQAPSRFKPSTSWIEGKYSATETSFPANQMMRLELLLQCYKWFALSSDTEAFQIQSAILSRKCIGLQSWDNSWQAEQVYTTKLEYVEGSYLRHIRGDSLTSLQLFITTPLACVQQQNVQNGSVYLIHLL
jgi:hypothetical protein